VKITEVRTILIGKTRLIRVLTDKEIEGIGKAAHDCHPATVAFAIRQLPLVGMNPGRISGNWQRMYEGIFWRAGLESG